MRILISGASGMIGSALARAAHAESWEVVRLVRSPSAEGPDAVLWNPADVANSVDPARLEGFDIVVHLSGTNVAHRWTPEFKRDIVASRVGSTQALCSALARLRNRPRVLLCASGSGNYGSRGDEILTEKSEPGSGFLADLCRAWENATQAASDAGLRVVHLRCGIVLDPARGAMAAMLPPFRFGVGGWLGSGRQ
ncbi:MAG: NAD-dependent epimerase/dehydratase family protein [Acidobacteriaceae bacterium]